MITVGIPSDGVSSFFHNVTLAATVTCDYCMNSENNLPVYIVSNPVRSAQAIWPSIKDFS